MTPIKMLKRYRETLLLKFYKFSLSPRFLRIFIPEECTEMIFVLFKVPCSSSVYFPSLRLLSMVTQMNIIHITEQQVQQEYLCLVDLSSPIFPSFTILIQQHSLVSIEHWLQREKTVFHMHISPHSKLFTHNQRYVLHVTDTHNRQGTYHVLRQFGTWLLQFEFLLIAILVVVSFLARCSGSQFFFNSTYFEKHYGSRLFRLCFQKTQEV